MSLCGIFSFVVGIKVLIVLSEKLAVIYTQKFSTAVYSSDFGKLLLYNLYRSNLSALMVANVSSPNRRFSFKKSRLQRPKNSRLIRACGNIINIPYYLCVNFLTLIL